MTFIIILCILLFGFASKGEAQITYTNVVETNSGNVVGEHLYTVLRSIPYASFRGIPYAEPPVGNLRFQPPVPKRPWQGIMYTTSDANKCIQMDRGSIAGSEDCLYLNVYTPLLPGSRLKPVIVWIHGGAFTTGNGNSSYYGPDFLLEQDVVVVSIQYRLGPLGFLNINHPSVSGNNGLKDQNLALRWVQRNIHQFLGDPRRVTLLGQSAGAVSVDLHKLSDMSAGLFQQTVSLSGSPLCLYWAFQSNTEAQAQAFLLGSKLGLRTNNKDQLLRVLLNTPAADIIEQASMLPLIPFRPTIERTDVAPNQPKFLTECTPQRYKEGRYNKGPHLMGFTSSEILSLAKTLDDLVKYTVLAKKIINDHTPIGALPIVPQIISIPLDGITALTREAFLQLIEELSDLFFVTGIDRKQQLLSTYNGFPIYYYRFSFKSQYSAHKSEGIEYLDGVAHEDELPYIFYRKHINIPLRETGIAITRERLVRMWTNFAKYGNPTPNNIYDQFLGVTWPDSRRDGRHLEIGQNLVAKGRPTNMLVRFYQLIGLGDSSILNDCRRNIASDVINGVVNIPGTFNDVISNPDKIPSLIPNLFG